MIWPTKKLGGVCDVVGGGTPSTGVSKYWSGDVVWITPKDLGKLEEIEVFDSGKKISEEGLKNSSARILPKGSVVLSSRAPIGYLAIAGVPLATNQGCRSFICNEKKIYNKFLYYFLQTQIEHMNNLGGGSTFKEISGSKLKEIEIPLPPLSEQKKIVARLEKLLAKVKEAKRLRAEAQEAIQNLLSAELHKIFEEGKMKGWKEKELSLLTEKTRMVDPKKEFESEFNYIDISSVSNSSESILAKNISSKEAPSRARKLVKEGDAIFATTRPYLKNIAFITKDLDGSIASTGFCVLRAKKELLDSKYLFLVVNSNPFVEEVSSFQKGATYPAVADSVIFSRKILLPSLSEQKKIVARLDALSEKIKKLRDYQKSTQSDLVALEQSILNQAFSRDK